MKDIALRGCNNYHHISGAYQKGKPVKVNDSLAAELMALKTEKGMPYFILHADAVAQDAITPEQQHQDRINAGANVVTLDDVVPESDEPAAVADATEDADTDAEVVVDEDDAPDGGVDV